MVDGGISSFDRRGAAGSSSSSAPFPPSSPSSPQQSPASPPPPPPSPPGAAVPSPRRHRHQQQQQQQHRAHAQQLQGHRKPPQQAGHGHGHGLSSRKRRGLALAAVVIVLAALQYSAGLSSPPSSSVGGDATSPRESAVAVAVAEERDIAAVAAAAAERDPPTIRSSSLGGVGVRGVATPRVLFLDGRYDGAGVRRRKEDETGERRKRRRRKREVELYPAEYSDVTQSYPEADSSDFPYNETIKRRTFPPDDDEGRGDGIIGGDGGGGSEGRGGRCVPMAAWQMAHRPTCNAFHELDAGGRIAADFSSRTAAGQGEGRAIDETETGMEFLGSGSWRDAWKIGGPRDIDPREKHGGRRRRRRRRGRRRRRLTAIRRRRLRSRKKKKTRTKTREREGEKTKRSKARSRAAPIVLKTWRFEHNVEDEYFEFNRVDAVVMDRLTSSRYVVEVYGMCGLSLLTEFAAASLTELADKLPPLGKLKLARDVARGLADVHGVVGAAAADLGGEGENGSGDDGAAAEAAATLVHNDLNTAHVVLREKGDTTPLFNDFNVARLQLRDERTGETCGFETTLFSPQWRSPEEQLSFDGLPHLKLTEKVDVYAFGNVCFRFATGQRAWRKGHGSLTGEYKSEIAAKKREGGTPPVPSLSARDREDPAVQALLAVARMCYEYDPADRPTAAGLVRIMDKAIGEIESLETASGR